MKEYCTNASQGIRVYFGMREYSLIAAGISIAKGYSILSCWISCPLKPSHCEEYLAGVEFALQRADLIRVLSWRTYRIYRHTRAFAQPNSRSKIQESLLSFYRLYRFLINFAESLSRLTSGLFANVGEIYSMDIQHNPRLYNRVSSNLHFKQRRFRRPSSYLEEDIYFSRFVRRKNEWWDDKPSSDRFDIT